MFFLSKESGGQWKFFEEEIGKNEFCDVISYGYVYGWLKLKYLNPLF